MRRISFDVDDTLTGIPGMPTEPPPRWWWAWLRPEPLRRGSVALMRELQRQGIEVWIYTTSYRSPLDLRCWLRAHGMTIAGATHQGKHDRVVGRRGPSKLPTAFGIGLHVDDSEGVAEEGRRHGFAVVVVAPGDPQWADRVRAGLADRAGPPIAGFGGSATSLRHPPEPDS